MDELQQLMQKLGTPDPDWQAFIDSLPDKYWAKYDLSALRLGWEAAKMRYSDGQIPSQTRR